MSINKQIRIYTDNTGAVALTNNPIFHNRLKHIDIHWHFIRDLIHMKTICTFTYPQNTKQHWFPYQGAQSLWAWTMHQTTWDGIDDSDWGGVLKRACTAYFPIFSSILWVLMTMLFLRSYGLSWTLFSHVRGCVYVATSTFNPNWQDVEWAAWSFVSIILNVV